MERVERLYKIRQLLDTHQSVSFEEMRQSLEVSPATLKRDLEYLRNRMSVPILWDAGIKGYRLDVAQAEMGGQYELPGLWFSAREIHALLTMQHLVAGLDPGGMLADRIAPLAERLNGLLDRAGQDGEEIRRRVLIVGQGRRHMEPAWFEKVGSALLRRKRLRIVYHGRSADEVTERIVSPQRLVHYRENWYLDAWCHLRRGLRNFAVDAIRAAEILDTPAREIPERTVAAVLGPGYGIFAGKRLRRALLRFTPERARWVAAEFWHHQQKGRFDADGAYLLEIPYTDHRELLMDILKHGVEVEVLAPPSLRQAVRQVLAQAAEIYGKNVAGSSGELAGGGECSHEDEPNA
jgi:predicted DNA-binding transcriptional regulator YafY